MCHSLLPDLRGAVIPTLQLPNMEQPQEDGAGSTTPACPVAKPVLNLFVTCLSDTEVKSLLGGPLPEGRSNSES